MYRALERLLLGRSLCGRYRLDEVLGRGGMSLVYRGADERLGRSVAVKLIQHLEGPEEARSHLRERFRREAASVARISPHPNVVTIYDYGTDPELDLDFIVMELLEGSDLKTLMSRESIAFERAADILLQTALGVAAGHRAGIVHRDVKPGNVFVLSRDASVRVLDFGIAKVLEGLPDDDLTRFGTVPHSPAYASPEQLEPARTLSTSSDVYQLGLLGYELFAGARPFSPGEPRTAGTGRFPVLGRWGSVPEPVRTVISRALETDPRRRYPDAAAFAYALRAAVEEAAPERAAASGGAAQVTPPLPGARQPALEDDPDLTVALPADEAGPGDVDLTLLAEPSLPGGGGADPNAKRSLPGSSRRGRRAWTWAPAAIGALLLVLAAGVVYLRSPPAPVPVSELEEAFRELQSEASRRLESSGAWDR